MKKYIAIFGIAGALWMIILLQIGSFRLAWLTDYPGIFATRWVQYKGIAPPLAFIWGFNIWLVITSAIEWILVGLALRIVVRRLLR